MEDGIGAEKIRIRYHELELQKEELQKQMDQLKRESGRLEKEQVIRFYKEIAQEGEMTEETKETILRKIVNSVYVYDDDHVDVFMNLFEGNAERCSLPVVRMEESAVYH